MSTYWEWLGAEAQLIDSDGCSKALGFNLPCCWEHDLTFFYGKDPRDAYRRWCEHGDRERAWREAAPITFSMANRRFKQCHLQRTRLGWWSWINPMVWWRWRSVARLSKGVWNEHRRLRPNGLPVEAT